MATALALLGCSGASETLRPRPSRSNPGYSMGSGDQAEPRLEQLPASPPVIPKGGSELDRAADLSRLAADRRAAGDSAGAIAALTDALEIREHKLGPTDPEVAATLNALAGVYAAQGDYRAAEPLLVRALAIRESDFGPNDRLTAQSLNNLALLYAAEGRAADAEPLYQRALAIFEAGHDPSELATTLENYAAMLADSGRTDEAAAAEQRARGLRAADVRKPPDSADD